MTPVDFSRLRTGSVVVVDYGVPDPGDYEGPGDSFFGPDGVCKWYVPRPEGLGGPYFLPGEPVREVMTCNFYDDVCDGSPDDFFCGSVIWPPVDAEAFEREVYPMPAAAGAFRLSNDTPDSRPDTPVSSIVAVISY